MPTGAVIESMSGDTILIQDAMGEKVGKFIQVMSTFVGGFIIAFVHGWKLTLVMLSAIPLIIVVGGSMAILTIKLIRKVQLSYTEEGNIMEKMLGVIRTVASFTGEKEVVVEYDKSLRSAYKVVVQQGFATGPWVRHRRA
eukprot:Gb_41370 [translate_table: standard]